MAADVKAFIRKWHGRTLDDDGCYVSKEFHSFQVAFFNAMRKIASEHPSEVVGKEIRELYSWADEEKFINN